MTPRSCNLWYDMAPHTSAERHPADLLAIHPLMLLALKNSTTLCRQQHLQCGFLVSTRCLNDQARLSCCERAALTTCRREREMHSNLLVATPSAAANSCVKHLCDAPSCTQSRTVCSTCDTAFLLCAMSGRDAAAGAPMQQQHICTRRQQLLS
jgi:hypothetical protein